MRSTTTTHVWANPLAVVEVLSGNLECSMQTKGFEPSLLFICQVSEQIDFWYIHLLKLFNVPVEYLKYVEISPTKYFVHT